MEARIVNFRRGRQTMRGNQMIAEIKEMTKEEANKLVGDKVIFKTESGKQIIGKVVRPHGNSGAMLLRFRKGMPGQAIGKNVEIVE